MSTPISFEKVNFKEVKVNGILASYTLSRIDRTTIPENKYVYELRHDEIDWTVNIMIEVNPVPEAYFGGTIITDTPMITDNSEYALINSYKIKHVVTEWIGFDRNPAL